MTNDVVEFDLHAYADAQLDVERRIEVEAYLSQHPQAAVQVMADLRVKAELRLALAEGPSPAKAMTREAAARLQRSLGLRHRYGALRRVAVVLVFIVSALGGSTYLGPRGGHVMPTHSAQNTCGPSPLLLVR
ncbi:anti-sigma factor family protein [Sinorhizobium meliloti]|uniref:anti-sigma factor family protein n=1 Tax=Rhizobium meliloti TaxID=382 RepID=UPI000FD914F2|nr:hypothetical protein [Sinorhizobium meliloti]RVQ47791.1 hypothetical protein CN245_31390 [Sinorhizobium meliloti]